ncbi:GFA family protein [Rhizobium puerariae]|uniref:GFA family protein n=1 Tax=Rhizobium puerariae TaxID=1585791 RepID=A0ABV6AE57_9HYPH
MTATQCTCPATAAMAATLANRFMNCLSEAICVGEGAPTSSVVRRIEAWNRVRDPLSRFKANSSLGHVFNFLWIRYTHLVSFAARRAAELAEGIDMTDEGQKAELMDVDGACHCGAITFTARIDPDGVHICHCTDCQALTGSAFRVTAPGPEDAFHLVSGSPSYYTKTGSSGAPRLQAFCGNCGSPIYATSPSGTNRTFGIRVGVIRQRNDIQPRGEIWCGSKLDWLPVFAGDRRDRQ